MPRIRQKTHHSPHKRTRIVMMKDLGVPLDEIVAKEGITKHAIFGIVRRYQSQISAKDKPRSGRPTILTDRDKKHIEQLFDRFPFITVQEIKDRTGISCHRSTITRWLKKQGIQHHQALRRPFLGPTAVQQRRDFAEKYRHEPASYWYSWFFSDEVSIDRTDGDITKWCFHRAGERLHRDNVQPRRTPLRHSKMFYGGFSIDRLSELVPLDGDPLAKRGGVTGRIILACLRQQLPAVLEEGMTLQHDNGPTYRARIVQNWLRIYCRLEGIFMVDWPAYSPDLNPIENLWKLLKERICKRYPELASMPITDEAIAALIEAAQEVWNDLEPEVLENLTNSMPKRLAALHQAKGYYTKY